ncbi:hypothetical protein [Halocatena marina]|uniref:hypothetical protein n=1 Tax=Halocatena marina TaxID=2934937 RepID=UPI00200C846E|nr:hypothetical protein [Halocatena marina]
MSVIEKLSDAFFQEEQQSEPYACQHCGCRFSLQHQVCPKCGGYAIERVDWSEIIGSESE